jgi:hypothetical protein
MRRALVAGLLALACSTPVEHSALPAASDHRLTRVAVVPLAFEPSNERNALPEEEAKVASSVVTARVAEALAEWAHLDVVPPGDVQLWLQAPRSAADPALLGDQLRSAFGADGVLTGRVRRYVPRQGGSAGAARPASVRFELELRTPEGVLLWQGSYDEAQSSVNEDPASFQRASERGFRWVTAEALARYGARELMRGLGGASASWR